MISEMLIGISNDFNKKASDLVPTIMTINDFDQDKYKKFKAGKEGVLEFVDSKYEKFLLASGDRFTKSGLTYGEIDLFAKLHCHAMGAYPEIRDRKLGKFYKRMSEEKGIKKVINGDSQFGKLEQYLVS